MRSLKCYDSSWLCNDANSLNLLKLHWVKWSGKNEKVYCCQVGYTKFRRDLKLPLLGAVAEVVKVEAGLSTEGNQSPFGW